MAEKSVGRRRLESVPDRPHAGPGDEERTQIPSHDQQALSAGHDAGTVARLQSDLHGWVAVSAGEYESSIRERLSLEQCLKAVDECDAPMVSICGGEPLLYPEIAKLVEEILARGKYIQLCTNGMFLAKKLKEFTPHPGLVFNIHLDGMEKNHDLAVEREVACLKKRSTAL